MCHKCHFLTTEDYAEQRFKLRTDLSEVTRYITDCLIQASQIEDDYRAAALLYYTTQLSAQSPAEFPLCRLDHLRNGFEVVYKPVFAVLNGLIKRLFNMGHKVIHYSLGACICMVSARYADQTIPARQGIEHEWSHEVAHFEMLRKDAEDLFDVVSKPKFETDADGVRVAWYDPVESIEDDILIPHRKEEEFHLFLKWTRNLPEVQRAMGHGRSL